MDDRQPVSLARRALSYLICYLVAVQPMLPAVAAQITPVTPGTQMDKSGNGVPVVNIATPNGAGISHNQYQQYNVGQEGLILNNATGQLNPTQLGGLIQNNPNLKAGHEAQAIINEVTGATRSQLQGYTEVAGKAANVIVANPYGITCNGCGFINTPNVTLTTGKPLLDANGKLSALEVSKGSVIVEGKGLDGSSADAVSIIARATEINAGIHAKDLSVIAGSNRVGTDGSVTPIAGEGSAPSVAVDTGALGGMYANRIHLVSSEKGVGVNLGNLVAKQGDIQLDANGKLTLSNSLSSGALTAKGTSVALNGDNKATGQIRVSAQQDATLGKGALVSDAGITVTAKGNLTASGTSLTAGRDIQLNAANLSTDKNSRGNAGGSIALQAQKQISNDAQLTAAKNLSLTAQQLNNSGALAAKTINVNTGGLHNSKGATVAATDSLQVISDSLLNQGSFYAPVLTINSNQSENSGQLLGAQAFSITGSRLNNLAGGTLSSSNAFSLNLPELNNGGLISSGATLTLGGDILTNTGEINADNLIARNTILNNRASGSLLAEHDLQLNNNALSNAGKMAASQLTISSADVNNSGTLQAQQTLQSQGQSLSNSGTLLSDGQLTLDATRLDNAGSLQGQQINLTAGHWQNSGKLLSLGDASISAGNLNNSGSIFSQQGLQLHSDETDNAGLIQGTRALDYSGNRLTNFAAGTLSSDNSFGLDLPELNNRGLITSGAALTLSGGSLTNSGEIDAATLSASNDHLSNQQGGLLLADTALALKNSSLTNAGQIAASQLNINSDVIDNSGTLQGEQSLRADGQQLTNSGTLLSDGQLTLNAEKLGNSGLVQGQHLTVTAGDWQNSGKALSVGDADLTANTLNNSGKILGQQNVRLQTSSTDNSGWLMAQALTLQGDLINSGLLQGNNALTMNGDKLVNKTSGQMLTAGDAEIRGSALDNQGAIQADRLDLTLQSWQNAGSARGASQLNGDVSGTLHDSGSLLSEQGLSLLSSEITNAGTLAASSLNIAAAKLTNAGLLQGNNTLTIASADIANKASGQLISGSSLSLSPTTLTNEGLLQVAGDFSLNGRDFSNSGRVTADNILTTLSGALDNRDNGFILAKNQAELQADELNNAGTLAAQRVVTKGDSLKNSGLMQGDGALAADFHQLDNLGAGQLLSGGDLSLKGTRASNSGIWQGNQLDFQFGTLTNSGTMNGIASLNGTVEDLLDNRGTLLSSNNVSLSAGNLLNSGKLVGDTLVLRGGSLMNSGLWQGAESLDAAATGDITQAATGKALSVGDLLLSANTLKTDGTLQGDSAQITADNWQHQGSLLGSKELSVDVSGELRNSGELLTQGAAQINAQNLVNSGALLAEKALVLNGGALNNSGTVQGDTLAIRPASITNQGSLIGLQSLTIGPAPASGLRMLAATVQPARVLVNNSGGQLLTQGTLDIHGDDVTNNGVWQGQQILLDAASLANGGAIQSAGELALDVSGGITSGAGSKITANGSAALNALSLTNQGQWIAKNLTLQGATLNNSGEISGVEGLKATLTGALTQQQNATLLSGGTLDLRAASVNNSGRIQGKDLLLTSGAVINSGRLQGDNGLVLNASGRLTNNASGTLLSQNDLTLTTPELFNYGLIQGATSRITATSLANNSGKLLSSADLTLTTPQMTNSGWLQASQLTLNATNASNSGTLMADQQATLTGTSLMNQGTAQGGTLAVNYAQLNNNGTVLGVSQLNVKAQNVTQQAAGKLFSGGNLLLESTGFDQLGQVVVLGDATLKLINGFTARNTLAAGNRLSITSNGAIDNRGTLQGQALTLSAGGDLTNNGQITTGTGDSSLSGNRINMNGAGTLQGGGNVTLSGRSDVTLNGFTGTRGNLIISSPGSIVNTALLYAGQNLYLYANSIRNQQGNILAGHNLVMQKDSAGNLNNEIINTSGTIETTSGDIRVNTTHLKNQWLSIQAGETTTENLANSFASSYPGTYAIPYTFFSPDKIRYLNFGFLIIGAGSHAEHGVIPDLKEGLSQAEVAVSRVTSSTIITGSAGRIAAGGNLTGYAKTLDNLGSYLLAGNSLSLDGTTLNNQSYLSGTQTVYRTYTLDKEHDAISLYEGFPTRVPGYSYTDDLDPKGNMGIKTINFVATDSYHTEGTTAIRGVIQANGNLNASFSNIVNDSESSDVRGTISPSLAIPTLATLKPAGINNRAQNLELQQSAAVAVGSPDWFDQLSKAVKTVNSGGALSSAESTALELNRIANNGVSLLEDDKKLNLENSGNIATPGHMPVGQKVDTSAYPIPTNQNGYFTVSPDSASPYLITVNPKLEALGELDQNLFGELNQLLNIKPSAAPAETRSAYTDGSKFLGSSYLLDRLQLKPEQDYRYLGDAAFDTRYVSNAVLSQTGNRYINGLGSDLEQMSYLMDNAAKAQQSLGLQFGVTLTAEQIASLDHSILWWEQTTLNGQVVMVPKLYLSPNDVSVANGSVIAGKNVTLIASTISNNGSTISAQQNAQLTSQTQIDNINSSLIQAGEGLNLSALGNINNIGSAISGKQVALDSIDGNIVNLTKTQTTSNKSIWSNYDLTEQGNQASITSIGSLSLVAGESILNNASMLKASDDLNIKAAKDVLLSANVVRDNFTGRYGDRDHSTVDSIGSSLSAGSSLKINAGSNLVITAGQLSSGGDMSLTAGDNLELMSQSSNLNDRIYNKETHNSGAERTTVSSGGNLTLAAGQDITSQAAKLNSGGNASLQAGRDITLNAEASTSGNSERGGKKVVISETVRQQGTEITSGGSTSLIAGRDITSEASDITADADLSLKAGRDVDLTTATESDYAYREETKTKKGFLKKTTTHTIQENSATREKGTQLSGDTVSVTAGNDLTVQGSSIAGDKGVSLNAGNDLSLTTATNTESTYSLKEVKKSGLMGGGLGLSYGKQSAKSERNGEQVTQSDARSLVGAGNGAVTMTAGNNALIKGSDVVAGGENGNISVAAKNIAIVAGQDQVRDTFKQESKSSGFGLSLNLTPLDTVRNLRDIMNNTSSVYEQVKQIGNEFGANTMDSPAPGLTYGRANSKSKQNTESVYQSGSTFNASGNLALNASGSADPATGNILIVGSSLSAGGKATLDATHDIDITTATDSQKAASSNSSKSWSATTSASLGALARSGGGSPNNGSAGTNYGSKKIQQSGNSSILTQHTSSITAGSVDVTSHQGDIAIAGSTLTGTNGVSLNAEQGKVSVIAGEDSQSTTASGSEHAIGDLGGDGYSGTVGVGHNSWKNASTGTQQSNVRSGIVSTQGDVNVNAGKDVNLQGADVFAGNALSVNGENIHLDPAKDTHSANSSSKSSQYGITAQVSGYGVSVAQAVDKVAQARKDSDDPRLQAIYAAQAAMTALSAYTQNTAAVKVTVSATAGNSHQSMEQSSTEQSGSALKAGGDVALAAKQDITGQGAKISGENVSMTAGRDIALSSAEDSSSQKSSSGGSKYGVGVGFGIGGSQNGFSIELAASQNSAGANGSSLTHHNSEVTATGDLTVKAGQDVKLNGANLNGNHVELDAGRNLEIASQQDRADYDSHQSSSGFSASICIPPICAGTPVSGSANMSGSKIYNDFDSVQQQSGISAGDGGYNIFVGNHTQLDGAVIASSATPDKNHLSTGTLGWTNIDNHANSGGSGFGVAVSGSMGGTTAPASDSFINSIPNQGNQDSSGGNSLPVATLQQNKETASSTTYSAISPGTIEIRNPDAQKQDVSQISRDTAAAENALKDKFDAQKAEDRLTIQKEIAALGQQTIQLTFDSLKKREKEKLENDEAFKGLSETEKNKARSELDKKLEDNFGIGSDMQIAAQAISGVFAGLAGGNISGAVAAGAAPLVAQMVKQVAGTNDPLRTVLHTLASGLIAKAQGGSAIGGAAGGMTAGLLGSGDALSEMLFGKKVDKLSADEKMLVANLVTLAGAAAGGIVDGSAGIGSGASTGRTEVENNSLALVARGCAAFSPCRNKVAEQLLEIGAKAGIVGIAGEAIKDVADKMSSDELDHLITLEMMGNNEITGKYLNSLQDKYGSGNSTPNIAKDLNTEEKKNIGGTGSSSGGSDPEEDNDWNKMQSAGTKDYKSGVEKGDKINLDLFSQRKSNSGGKAEFVDPKTGWRISPDRAGNNSHGGSAWKLLDKNGNRIATLDKNGNVLRK